MNDSHDSPVMSLSLALSAPTTPTLYTMQPYICGQCSTKGTCVAAFCSLGSKLGQGLVSVPTLWMRQWRPRLCSRTNLTGALFGWRGRIGCGFYTAKEPTRSRAPPTVGAGDDDLGDWFADGMRHTSSVAPVVVFPPVLRVVALRFPIGH